MKTRIAAIVGGAWLVVAAGAALLSYQFIFSSSSTSRPVSAAVDRDPGVEVAPGHALSAVERESGRIGFDILVPRVVAGPETELYYVHTNSEEAQTQAGSVPTAELRYKVPGANPGDPPDVIQVYETDGVDPAALSNATAVALPSGKPYHLWVQHFPSTSSHFAAVYTFKGAGRTVSIVFSTPKAPSEASIVEMYESMH